MVPRLLIRMDRHPLANNRLPPYPGSAYNQLLLTLSDMLGGMHSLSRICELHHPNTTAPRRCQRHQTSVGRCHERRSR
jgi:predicted secreted protein